LANDLRLSLLQLSDELEGDNQVAEHDCAAWAKRSQALGTPVREAKHRREASHGDCGKQHI
jgi:hypothetical protein